MPVYPPRRLRGTEGRDDALRGSLREDVEVVRSLEECGFLSRTGASVDLSNVDLGPAALDALLPGTRLPRSSAGGLSWPAATLHGASMEGIILVNADLQDANLCHANLRRARLDRTLLERANMASADLASGELRGASLGGADLTGALLEDAVLTQAHLRFATLAGAVLENADLEGADFWGAVLDRALLSGSRMSGAILQEASLQSANLSNVDLRNANLTYADLRNANLRHADLRGALLQGARLDGANLSRARLDDVDLSTCELRDVSLSAAVLNRTLLVVEQFDGGTGEEKRQDWDEAAKGYLALERNLAALGDMDGASWAYRRRRRMKKRGQLRRAGLEWSRSHRTTAVAAFARYCTDLGAEWLCDYGESIPRVLIVILMVFLLFIGVYFMTDSVIRVADHSVTHDVGDLAVFSLLAMTTSGNPAVGLLPRQDVVHLLTGAQAVIGVTLFGLLGFVLGHRIRR